MGSPPPIGARVKVTVASDSRPAMSKVGVVSSVTLSVFKVPESLAAWRSGVFGAEATLSMTRLGALAAEASRTFPARSVCLAVTV